RRHTRWPRDWSSDVCSSDLFCGAFEGPHSPPIASCMNSTRGTNPVVESTYCEKSIVASSLVSASINPERMRLMAAELNSPLQFVEPYGFAAWHVALVPPV